MTPSTAERVYGLASWTVVVAAMISALASLAARYSSKIREDGLRIQLVNAHEEARAAKLALDRFRAPRAITSVQASRIHALLTPFSGTTFDYFYFAQVPEISSYADGVFQLLEGAGWRWNGGGSFSNATHEYPGVTVFVMPGHETDPSISRAADALTRAISDAGFTSRRLAWNTEVDWREPNWLGLLTGNPEVTAKIRILVADKD